MNKFQLLLIGSLFVLGLFTSSFIPYVEAKPNKTEPTQYGLIILTCTGNNGILTCVVKSASGATVGFVTLTRADGGGEAVCDVDLSDKKRISVTTRHSENPDCANETHFKITVLKHNDSFLLEPIVVEFTFIDGIPVLPTP